jgi:pyrroloquinoline quinone biosynthesis protein D
MSATTSLSSRPRRRAGLQLRVSGDEAALLDPTSDAVHVLNDTALALWELCDGETSVEEMVVAAVGLFDADEGRLEQDVLDALDAMAHRGLLDSE